MKLLSLAILGLLVGLAAGLHFGTRQVKELTCLQNANLRAKERLLALVSVSVLDKLEEGQTDKAKSLLAAQVAQYYLDTQQLDGSPAKKELLRHIEVSSGNSSQLKNALNRQH